MGKRLWAMAAGAGIAAALAGGATATATAESGHAESITSAVKTLAGDGYVWKHSKSSGVNIRSAPNVGAPVVGKMSLGDDILSQPTPFADGGYGAVCGSPVGFNTWFEVDHWGKKAYVAAVCLESNVPSPPPAPTPPQ